MIKGQKARNKKIRKENKKKKVDRNEREVCTEFKYLLGFRIRMLSFKTKEFIPIKFPYCEQTESICNAKYQYRIFILSEKLIQTLK